MKPVHYLLRISKTKDLDERKSILREAAVDGCEELFLGFQLCYSKIYNFEIITAPIIKGEFSSKELHEEGSFTFQDFTDLISDILSGNLNSEEIKQRLYKSAENSNILEWNMFYRCILLKDMNNGLNSTIINKVLNEIGGGALKYLIPKWKIQELSISKTIPKWEAGLEPFLNGERVLTIIHKDYSFIKMYDIKGNIIKNDIIKNLYVLMEYIPINLVLDGEIVNDRYALYDIIPLEDFEYGECQMIQKERQETLTEIENIFHDNDIHNIYVIPKLKVNLKTERGLEKFNEFVFEMKNLNYNNIIIKNMNSFYVAGKSKNWIKFFI